MQGTVKGTDPVHTTKLFSVELTVAKKKKKKKKRKKKKDKRWLRHLAVLEEVGERILPITVFVT